MKNFFRLNIVMMALAAIVMVGCNENEDPLTPTATKPPAPSGVAAQSVSANSIRLKWTPPSSTVDVTGYVLMAVEKVSGGTAPKIEKIISGAGATTGVIDGLTEGKIYELMVHSLNDTVRSDASPSVEWAPARRGTGTYKLYSSTNTTLGSGLGIFNRSNGPAVLKIDSGDVWDICFDDKTSPSDPRIASPGQTDYVDGNVQFPNGKEARIIYWGKQYSNITSLDDIYETEALVAPTTNGEKFYSIGTIGGTANWGSAIMWKDGTGYWYGKVVMKRTGGAFVQGSGANAFIEVEVSYQNVKDLPYAIKQRLESYIEARSNARGGDAK